MKENIVLIGMPGVGKSTIGVVLAKMMGYRFIDADLMIQEQEGKLLCEIIKEQGTEGFLAVENRVNSSIRARRAVIATGGSVVYGAEAMRHLKEIGTVVYLKLPFAELSQRLSDIKGRGVVLKKGQTLLTLYEERVPLYERYADFTVDEHCLNVEQTIEKIDGVISMKKIEFTKKAKIQASVVGAGFLCLLAASAMQQVGIGQAYQTVTLNGTPVGSVAENTDVNGLLQEARREVSLETGERLSLELDCVTEKSRGLFEQFLSESELKEAFKGMIRETNTQGLQRAYTVAIDGYRANFLTLADVETFLNRVKAPLDETGQYQTTLSATDSHIKGIMSAALSETEPEQNVEVIPEETLANGVSSGAQADVTYAMQYAMANPSAGGYETGILDLEFVEKVEVYENFIKPEELSDMEEAVVEVTKQKESNKIYVVQSGDCLSVIAMDHDTTVSSIVALNGLSSADEMIRDGQELIDCSS